MKIDGVCYALPQCQITHVDRRHFYHEKLPHHLRLMQCGLRFAGEKQDQHPLCTSHIVHQKIQREVDRFDTAIQRGTIDEKSGDNRYHNIHISNS
jgi:hypothetical protein